MATYPQAMIPAFPAGYAPVTADFTTWLQKNFQFLAQRPLFRAIQQVSGGQPLTGGAVTGLHFGATAGDILEDPYGGWSNTATGVQAAWSWLAPYTGWYEVTLTCSTQAASLWAAGAVLVSGGTPQYMELANTDASTMGGCTASLIVPCYGGTDYIQAGPFVSAAAATDTSSAGRYPALEIAYVSGG